MDRAFPIFQEKRPAAAVIFITDTHCFLISVMMNRQDENNRLASQRYCNIISINFCKIIAGLIFNI